jgi:succinate dehydrogenase / fumarate reductase cytochrome b subunit
MSDSSAHDAKAKRPLSPHLQVYKPQLTSVLSILHRLTGVALIFGTILVAVWLVAAASGEDAYNAVHGFVASPLGLFMVFGWSVALFYHLSNGIRHLFWDLGYLFKIENAYKAGYVVLLSTVILTAGAWGCAYMKYKDGPNAPAVTQQLADALIEEGLSQ